jgi:hypothetical protein
MHLHKRGISSPAALRQSLKNRRDKLLSKIKGAESEDQASLPSNRQKLQSWMKTWVMMKQMRMRIIRQIGMYLDR